MISEGDLNTLLQTYWGGKEVRARATAARQRRGIHDARMEVEENYKRQGLPILKRCFFLMTLKEKRDYKKILVRNDYIPYTPNYNKRLTEELTMELANICINPKLVRVCPWLLSWSHRPSIRQNMIEANRRYIEFIREYSSHINLYPVDFELCNIVWYQVGIRRHELCPVRRISESGPGLDRMISQEHTWTLLGKYRDPPNWNTPASAPMWEWFCDAMINAEQYYREDTRYNIESRI